MRNFLFAVFCLSLFGCGPQVRQEELGTVIYEVPKFDPVDQAYPMPKLGKSSGESDSTDEPAKPTTETNTSSPDGGEKS